MQKVQNWVFDFFNDFNIELLFTVGLSYDSWMVDRVISLFYPFPLSPPLKIMVLNPFYQCPNWMASNEIKQMIFQQVAYKKWNLRLLMEFKVIQILKHTDIQLISSFILSMQANCLLGNFCVEVHHFIDCYRQITEFFGADNQCHYFNNILKLTVSPRSPRPSLKMLLIFFCCALFSPAYLHIVRK